MKTGISIMCILLVVGVLVFAGFDRELVWQVAASARHEDWTRFWRAQSGPADLVVPGDPLPTNLPGPADAWAGNQSHVLSIRFHAEQGRHLLELTQYEAHEDIPPRLEFRLNGEPIRTVRAPSGGGRPPPYGRFAPRVTARLAIDTLAGENELSISTIDGSWIAPARLRLLGERRFYPSKLAWTFVTDVRVASGVMVLLLAAVYFRVRVSRPREQAISAVVLAVLTGLASFGISELVFRQVLLRAPEARIVGPHQLIPQTEAAGQHYTYSTMIQPSPNLDIIYTLKPNLDGFFARYPLKTNRQGMRGPWAELVAAPGTLRVMGLGDSVMFGWGVAWEDIALTQLGTLLSENTGRAVETLNLGCPSYNVANEVAVYARIGRAFRPDVVVLIVLENDFGFPGAMLEPVRAWTLRRSYLRQQLTRRLAAGWRDGHTEYEPFVSTRHLEKAEDQDGNTLDPLTKWRNEVSEHYHSLIGPEAVEANLRDLAAMLKEDGAQGIVLYHPIAIQLGVPESYEPRAAFVVEAAQQAGLLPVDMTTHYETYMRNNSISNMADALWVHAADWHPNATAHTLMAEAAHREIQRSATTFSLD